VLQGLVEIAHTYALCRGRHDDLIAAVRHRQNTLEASAHANAQRR